MNLPDDLAGLKRQVLQMLLITAASFVVATIAGVSYFGYHVQAMVAVFVAAIAVGVGAQIRFIIAFARLGGPGKG